MDSKEQRPFADMVASENVYVDEAASPPSIRRRSIAGRRKIVCVFLGWISLAVWIISGVHLWRSKVALGDLRDIIVNQPKEHSSLDRSNTQLHLLIPATGKDVNLCKLLIGASILDYPAPTLLAWNETYEAEGMRGGGSHTAKVSRVLDYLNALGDSHSKDLVVMLDAYDIHIQLPKSVMIDRFYAIQERATRRLLNTVGQKATRVEKLSQRVLFGSGKRCAPNQRHTVACYPLPESPLPDDLYGIQTDTIYGRNQFYSNKQRFLNSGYIIGEVADMRALFKDAWKLIEEHPDVDPVDSGSHTSDYMYGGSDQSIFAAMLGRQEWAREKLRLRHAPWGSKPRSTKIYGTLIDNVLSPSLTHEVIDLDLSKGNAHEYGIFLDYWSEIGHQTKNSEEDAAWVIYGGQQSIEEQVGPRSPFDCPMRVPSSLPADIRNSSISLEPNSIVVWEDQPLYTHLCMSTIPVFVHMNGFKEHREERWTRIWWQPYIKSLPGRVMTQSHSKWAQGGGRIAGEETSTGLVDSLRTDKGDVLSWPDLCPVRYHAELFRDVVV